MSLRIICIPDTHSRPGISDRRFRYLNKLIKAIVPDAVVHLGDHWDFPSMCTHDEKRSDFHQRSYEADLEKGVSDLELVLEGTRVPGHYVEGNHDNRIKRFLDENERFREHVRLPEKVLPLGWKYYEKELRLGGIIFKHKEVSGIGGRPVGGDHPAYTILKKNMCSTIVGHSHNLDIARRTRGDGKKITCIVAGCFIDKNQRERYAKDTQRLWENGILILDGVREGEFDFSWKSYKQIEGLYA